jgi:hypothetical protein
MPVPQCIMDIEDPWDFFLDVGIYAGDHAEKVAGKEMNLEKWYAMLPARDFHLALLASFFGTWENAGTMLHQAAVWGPDAKYVREALCEFGCTATAQLFDQAIALNAELERKKIDIDEADEQLRVKIARIDEGACADTSYEKLAAFIREHSNEFFIKG